jgi:branched-chain amino acid aminotransferase
MWYNQNGKIVRDISFDLNNRSFKYGDGVFETLRFFNGIIFNKKNHLLRMEKALNMVDISMDVSSASILEQVIELSKKNNIVSGGARVTIFRSGLGKYTPQSRIGCFLIETYSVEGSNFSLNSIGLELAYYTTHLKPKGLLSNLKSTSALFYVLASIEKQKNHLDDLLLLNTDKEPIEACSSNLFLVKNDRLITPSLSSGCLEGCMRAFILDNFEVDQHSISKQDIVQSSELILTNSNSIRWVKSVGDKIFHSNKIAGELVDKCNQLI